MALAARAVDVDGDSDARAGVGLDLEARGFQLVDHPRHACRGVVLHMAHIGLHHAETVLRHHLAELFHALGVGRCLCLQVGDVLRRVAGRVGALREKRRALHLHGSARPRPA